MITATKMLYLYTETPLHVGTGSGLSSIDLPIQRERTTQYPMIQGSGIKGKLRAVAEETQEKEGVPSQEDIDILFGPRNGSDHAGALIAGDARILLFPVRSLSGVFAYTTCYDVLSRFKRDIERNQKISPLSSWNIQDDVTEGNIQITQKTKSGVSVENTVVLEEFSFEVQQDQPIDTIAEWIASHALPNSEENSYWRNKIRNSLVILPNNDFRDFVLHATEIITRIKLDRTTKTVDSGMLWTEEHLPTDTLLYVPMYATAARKNGSTMNAEQVLEKATTSLKINYLQLGGDETVGRGIVCTLWGG